MHVLRNFKLKRRTLLRGTGAGAAVAIGLPALEAMLNTHGDALAGGEPLPQRFISYMFGNGVQLANWEPNVTGAGWADAGVPSLLQPLVDVDVQSYVNICTGMQNNFGGGAITHHEGMCIFSGYDFVLRPDLPGFASDWGGPTIDQVIADAIEASGAGLPIRSLQVGLTKFDSPADNGTTAKAISARGAPGALTTLYPEQNPVEVWQAIFGEFTSLKDDREVRLSVLDAVKAEADRVKMKLGTKDVQRVDAHLQGISELEAKISALPPVCAIIDEPTVTNNESNGSENLIQVNQIMSELIANAFVCDITRVASNMVLGVAGEVVFGDLGNSGTQHGNSHANNQEYHDGIQFCVARYAQLLDTLRNTPDGAGNLLDNSIVFCSSEISQGWSHSWQRQPILIGGHGGGYLQNPGIHYQATPQNSPNDDGSSAGNTSDILLAMLRNFDADAASVGGGAPMSTDALSDILA